MLIPHKTTGWDVRGKRIYSLEDGPAPYQVVGEVMAHQAKDG